MKKTLAALVAVTTIAGSLAVAPAAKAGDGARSQPALPARPGRRRCPARRRDCWRPSGAGLCRARHRPTSKKPPAAGFASASGTATAGASVASRFAT